MPFVAANRVFVSNSVFDGWVSAGGADLDGARLRARGTGASYAVEEAIHVVAEVSGGEDVSNLVGCVRKVTELAPMGAELLDRSMVIGDLAYDVVPGFLVSPLGPPFDRVSTEALLGSLSVLSESPAGGPSDAELLARYLIEKLE
jgi:hypothetical protein